MRNVREAVNIRSKYLSRKSGVHEKLVDAVRLWTRPEKTVLFYPDSPAWISKYVPFRLCALLRYKVINDPGQYYDVAIKFHDSTFSRVQDLTAGITDLDNAVNGRSLDISKNNVESTFNRVFGYPLSVDPTQYEGAVVVKSNENYAHDGRVIECPISASEIDDDCVYQKAIDTETNEGYFLDYRVPIIGGTIPLVYLKFGRPRFKNSGVSHVKIVQPGDIFESSEIVQLSNFAQAMKLDYGELDVLRNSNDGHIYVVDVANTPTGPSYGITEEQRGRALHLMLPAFQNLIENFERGS